MAHLTGTVEIRCKNVPEHVMKTEWFRFVNGAVPGRKKWRKHYKQRNDWVIVVAAAEQDAWRKALNGKSIQGARIKARTPPRSSRATGSTGGATHCLRRSRSSC